MRSHLSRARVKDILSSSIPAKYTITGIDLHYYETAALGCKLFNFSIANRNHLPCCLFDMSSTTVLLIINFSYA